MIIPKDLTFKYENESAVNDILTMCEKYNFSEDEKRQLNVIVSKCRRSGFIKCYNLMIAELKQNELKASIENLTKTLYQK